MEQQINEALDNETEESLTMWLSEQRLKDRAIEFAVWIFEQDSYVGRSINELYKEFIKEVHPEILTYITNKTNNYVGC